MAKLSAIQFRVNITLVVDYYGEGATSENIERFNEGIEKYWSGTFGIYEVKTTVRESKNIDDSSIVNPINIEAGSGISSVLMTITEEGDGKKATNLGGTWYSDDEGWTAAHEAGHLMGLSDRYHNKTTPQGSRITIPHLGFESNIMGSYNSTDITESQIEEIIHDEGNNTSFDFGESSCWIYC